MPQIVEHIDKIARDIGRGVLFLEFHPEYNPEEDDFTKRFKIFDYENCEERKQVLKWFEENNIKITPCFNTRSDGCFNQAYQGELYIDLPYDESNSKYMKVNSYFENPDDGMKIKDVRFMNLSLEIAMRYKHHDEPGFWDDM